MKLAKRLMGMQGGAATGPSWADVAMLIQPAVDAADNSTAITDAKGLAVTRYNALIKTALGYPAIYFDGNGDYLAVGAYTDVSFMHRGAVPWTVDFWIRTTADLDCTLFDTARGSTVRQGVYCAINSGKVNLQVLRGVSSSFVFNTTFDYTLSANTLYHAAIMYDHSLASENGKLWINGAKVATGNKTGNNPGTGEAYGQFYLGAFDAGYPTYNLAGYLRAFRVTKSIWWASTFTPPAYPLPTS